MIILFNIIIWLLLQQNVQQYPLNKKHEPSSKGIEMYVKNNTDKLISEFQNIVGDTLYDVYVYTDDLSSLTDYDTLDLGAFYIPNEIVITTEEKFVAYELKDISKYQKNSYIKANNFVKGTVFHELMHYYFNQVIREMQMKQQSVSIEYNNFSIVPKPYALGSRFIEEGICEYITVKSGECIFPKKFYQPESLEDITNKNKKNDLLYEYSVEYVRSFVDYFGYKKAIQLLVGTKPPTNEQILYPGKFFINFQGN